MELPYPDNAFDVAVMPLVIFFVPDPAKGVAEMARVVSPGGIVAAYAWDLPGKGFPYVALQEELREMGIEAPMPPSPDASRIEVLRELWSDAGLESIVTRVIRVQRTFTDFEEYWATILGGPSAGPVLAAMEAEQVVHLQSRLRLRLPADATGRITYGAWANAVSGRVP
jgi:SAM-dependent methyltransferase